MSRTERFIRLIFFDVGKISFNWAKRIWLKTFLANNYISQLLLMFIDDSPTYFITNFTFRI